jgi:hypothetical protein
LASSSEPLQTNAVSIYERWIKRGREVTFARDIRLVLQTTPRSLNRHPRKNRTPTITAGQATGFNLYMLKAMLYGDGHQILDIAKSNLWR